MRRADRERKKRRRIHHHCRRSLQTRQARRLRSRCKIGERHEALKGKRMIQKITPFLWFNDQAEEAAKFYTSIFKNSKIGAVVRYGDSGPGPKGSVLVVDFQLEGQTFTALNGGPQFEFTQAVS